MIRFARLIGLSLGLCAVPFHAGCSRGDKARVCKEFEDVMRRHYDAPGDMRKMAEIDRDAAKVLEGLRGVREVDVYRRDLERMADAIDALRSKGSVATLAYEEATRALTASTPPFQEYCYQ